MNKIIDDVWNCVFAAYSIALVPTRVAQALNLKLDDTVGGQPQHLHRFNVCSNLENGNNLLATCIAVSAPMKFGVFFLLFIFCFY